MTNVRRTLLLALVLTACRGASPSAQAVSQQQLSRLVDSLMPVVAKAAGLEFKGTPRSAVRTREEIRAYLVNKMARELPPQRLEGVAAAYRLLTMLPDSIDLRQMFLDLYTEQIAGFYDPDSTTLFAVQGGDPAQLRLVLAHELVHALQHQYVPLDSILRDSNDADRQAAAQAVMEGQATLASLIALVPGMNLQTNDAFWATFREQLRAQQTGTSFYARAPMVIREGLTFPYIEGADFVRWFDNVYPGKVPFGHAMPLSTEQVLHHDRYQRGDLPLTVRFTHDSGVPIFEDTFGEFDIDLLRTKLTGEATVHTDPAIGWGGDRLRIYRTPAGPALVWMTVWDDAASGAQFQSAVGTPLSANPRTGYRIAVERRAVGRHPGVRVVVAPAAWEGWKSLPEAEILP